MTLNDFLATAFATSNFTTMAVLFGLMAIIAAIEVLIPLCARDRWRGPHVAPNLMLTVVTFTMSLLFGAAIIVALAWLQRAGLGFLNWYPVDSGWGIAAAILVLDFSTYVCHVALHKVPAWWRFHRVHHSDPAVDVTTSFRQHPGEGLIRYTFLAIPAFALGASPAAFGLYRSLSVLTALLEHANVRVPRWLDEALSLVTTWPTFHKVHHSRAAHETDSNYGNIFSFWDRLFFTATPVRRGREVDYGLDDFDDVRDHTAWGLLVMPFRRRTIRPDTQDGRAWNAR
jgi:sterol desaturase/sphingolipid hydroxylase (fatty acid hydroxylase superfamily)